MDAFQSGLTEHMEELRTLVIAGVGIQQQQLQTLDEQMQSLLNYKDKVLKWEPFSIFIMRTFIYYVFALTQRIDSHNLQAVGELKHKLGGLQDLYLSQLELVHSAVHAHEATSTSTFKTLNSTVTSHPEALEQVSRLWSMVKLKSLAVHGKNSIDGIGYLTFTGLYGYSYI